MIVYSGTKPANSCCVGRTSKVRIKRLCQANSLITRTLTRCSGCDPPNRSATYNLSLPPRAAIKSSFNAAKCAGSIPTLVLPHQMLFSVSTSRTIYLSFAERPVCKPVLTTNGPSLAIIPSLFASAASTSWAVPKLQCSSAPVPKPCCESAIFSGVDIGCSGESCESGAYVCTGEGAAGIRCVGQGQMRGGWIGREKRYPRKTLPLKSNALNPSPCLTITAG